MQLLCLHSTRHQQMYLCFKANYQLVQEDTKWLISRRAFSFHFRISDFIAFLVLFIFLAQKNSNLFSVSFSGCHGSDSQEPRARLPIQHHRLWFYIQIIIHNQPELRGGKTALCNQGKHYKLYKCSFQFTL